MSDIQLTLLSKPGCHLCDDARAVVTETLRSFAESAPDAPAIHFDEKSILDDRALLDEYAEDIPVVLINGRVHTVWRVDPARLSSAIRELV